MRTNFRKNRILIGEKSTIKKEVDRFISLTFLIKTSKGSTRKGKNKTIYLRRFLFGKM